MAKVEVDEVELQQNVTARRVLEGLAKNPRTAKKLYELVKEVDPNAKISEPAPDPYEQKFSALEKELAEEKKARAEAEAKREQDEKIKSIETKQAEGFAALRQERWTDDGIEKVKKVMNEHGILDVRIAADHVEKQFPQQQPVVPNGSGAWNFMDMPADGEADLKKLIETKGESSTLLDKMARDALSDYRGQGQQRH